jgi:hypothetical protein
MKNCLADLSHLRMIGILACVMIPSEKHLEKLDERSKECKLLGYDGNSQYTLYELESGKVIWSRDVVFEEKLASGGKSLLGNTRVYPSFSPGLVREGELLNVIEILYIRHVSTIRRKKKFFSQCLLTA